MNNNIEDSTIEIIKAQRDLAIKLNSISHFDKLLELCIETAITISGMDSGGIYLVNKNSGDIELKCHIGLSDEFVLQGKYYKSGSQHAEIIMKGQPLYITFENIDSVLDEQQKKEGLKSLAILPVKNKNIVIACINVASHSKHEIHQSLLLPLETMLAVIGNTIAKSLTEIALIQSEEKFSKAFNSNPVLMAITEIETGQFIEVNNTFLNVLGFEKDEVIGKKSKELNLFVDPEQRDFLIKKVFEKQQIIDVEVEIFTKQKKKMIGSFYADIIKIMNKPYLLTTMQDITQRKKTENKLKQSLEEKDILLRETHHRVKNNLQFVSSLLDLQANSINNDKFKNAIEHSQSRIQSMSLVHDMIYKSDNLTTVNCKNYLERIIQEIYNICLNDKLAVNFELDIDNIDLEIEKAIPYALIINELIANSFQHAFTNTNTAKIEISLKQNNDIRQLRFKDNGIGINKDFDISSIDSLGLKLVNILVKQIQGDLIINSNNGTEFIINFSQ